MPQYLRYFILMALSALLLAGCASSKPALQPLPAAQPMASTHTVLGPGDVIDIKFAYANQFNESQTVRPDGKIVLLIGPVTVQGKTPDELLREEIEGLYADQLKHPQNEIPIFVRLYINREEQFAYA